MRGFKLQALLAGSALALVLAIQPASAASDGATPDPKLAAAPMPQASEVQTPAVTEPAVTGSAAPAAPEQSAAEPASAESTSTTQPAPSAIPVEPPKSVATPATPAVSTPSVATPSAATPSEAPAKAASVLSSQDQAVADKIKDVLTAKTDRYFANKKERAAVEQFYAARNYAPLWSSNGSATDRTKAAIAYLRSVDSEGLDSADYPTPNFASIGTVETLTDDEMKLTSSIVTFAHHASAGRVHFSRVSADIFYNLAIPEPNEVLAKVADAKDIGEALASYNPQQPGYKALKSKLAELRGQTGETGPTPIPAGPVLKLGKKLMQDPRVPLLRERLGVGNVTDTSYDKDVADAVKKFQAQKDLAENGHLTAATVEALNGGPRRGAAIDTILVNMERWRWMPRDLGDDYVMLNIPDFTLRVMNHGKLAWTTRVVTGKPSTPTPLLSETMKYITVNPTWNVPPSIINNEYLPALRQDPDALARIGLKVETNRDGTLRIYQPPGDGNALGRIRFNFPNKFLVYQHDTPDKNLFAREERAYSHGCMRVQYPDKYAEVLLSIANPKDSYSAEGIRRMYGSGERQIDLQKHIPVHITYQTAFVDDAGKLQLRKDIYGRDARMIAIMKGDERKVADIAVERANTTVTRPARAPDGMVFGGPGYGGQRYASSGPSFFDILFGGARAYPPEPSPQPAPRRHRTR
jgi:murein L,D-transpeptidase YcbB/YkuD